MSRNDMHLDGMLRHLGAAYYDSLHGRAAQADVTRGIDRSLNGSARSRSPPCQLRARTPIRHAAAYPGTTGDYIAAFVT